jgi:hypothetical protein
MRAITFALLVMMISAAAWAGRAYASPCHQFTVASAVPSGFGVPFDVLSEGNAPLITGDCTDGGVAVSVGAETQAVYRYGYIVDGGQWKRLELAGAPYTGDWLLGRASVTLPRPAAADASVSFIAFTCTRIGGFVEWKCGCRHYYCDVPMWQLQQFRYGPAPPQPEALTARDEAFFSRAGEIRPDGSMILLDGHIVHTTNFWTRVLPDRVPSDFTSPVNYAGGRMDVRLEVLSMADSVPFFYEICFENGAHGMDGWGETCTQTKAAWITGPGVYTWSDPRPPDHWWQNRQRFDWQGGQRKRITINYRSAEGEVFIDDDLPLDVRLTIIFTPAGKPFAGFNQPPRLAREQVPDRPG